MSKLTSRLWAKLTALILITVFVVLFAAFLFGIVYLAANNGYTLDAPQVLSDAVSREIFSGNMATAWSYYTNLLREEKDGTSYDDSWYTSYFSPENTNFFFTVTDMNGEVLFESGEEAAPCRYSETETDSITYHWHQVTETLVFDSEADEQAYVSSLLAQNFEIYEHTRETNAAGQSVVTLRYTRFDYDTVILTGYVRQELSAKDAYYFQQLLLGKLLALRYWLIAFAALSLSIILALLVFLLCAAGRKPETDGVQPNWIDRIPLDLYLCCIVCCVLLIYACWSDAMFTSSFVLAAAASGVALVLLTPICVGALMSISTRFKAGSWWKNTVIYRALRLCLRFVRWMLRGVRALIRALPVIWQGVLLWLGASLLALLFAAAFDSSDGAFLVALLFWLLVTAVLLLVLVSMRRLQNAGRALAGGKLDYAVDTSHLHLALREHAENLNSIAGGMQKAVNQQMRSERFRTELITNVSHDIKTPLTSIINYVDLLSREEMPSEQAREYLAVLSKQAARLKKLTEDLLEASKASTGAISVTLEPTQLNVLLTQVAGEYIDRLQAAGIEPVFKPDPTEPQILADGKLLWRVFDNLLSNVCKYALPGTRVYLSSEVKNGKVSISFRNISKYALNISADELMERFVRGDASRSTEGSGLGLSIAQSLTQLQKGEFALSIDGDLFKAVVTFDLLT